MFAVSFIFSTLLALPLVRAAPLATGELPTKSDGASCTLLPLSIHHFHTVDNGSGLHDVTFDYVFSTAEQGTTNGTCTVDPDPNASAADARTGHCTPMGYAFFRYQYPGSLSVGVDFLCSPEAGTPEMVMFNGTVPLKCSSAPGARACFQDGEYSLDPVSS